MPASGGFAQRLQAAIDASRKTKSQLSQDSGVGRTTLDEWLRGRLPVKAGPVEAVARSLGVDFDELWGSGRPLQHDERTRLLHLEVAVRQMRAILEQLEDPEEIPSALSAVEPQEFEPEAAEPQRRRSRGKRA